MPEYAKGVRDQDQLYFERFDARLRTELGALITPELMEEHRGRPLGQHSDGLERVLNFLRSRPGHGKYVLFELQADRAYKIVVLSGSRNEPPTDVDDRIFRDKAEALHAVFELRVRQTFGWDGSEHG